MPDLLLTLDNREVFTEILHHSIDFLIKAHPTKTAKSRIYGNSADEYESTIKNISNNYKIFCLKQISEAELLGKYSHMNSDLQKMILPVFKAREQEIKFFLLQEHNSKIGDLVESFDWNVNLIFGDSSLPTHRRIIGKVILNCLDENLKSKQMHFEVDKKKLNEIISVLEGLDL
uniref:COMMD8 helical N-terminal domain-containing protein n=1 Tax=Megaselia scalaris TaxID=36166 RepID=T1GYU0_MEGSC